MGTHLHDFDGRWPFQDAEDTAAFCCSHVFSGEPILYVIHDHDGDWQFLCGGLHANETPNVVGLGCMVEEDASLWSLADMPTGWEAARGNPGEPWDRERQSPPDEDCT